jgi:FkbM family methyltransferase
MNMDGILLKLNLSHNLPLYYTENQNYDRALPKICKYLHAHDGKMKLIDIGANIGDTAAFVDNMTQGYVLCIEGSPYFISLLSENIKYFKNCHVEIDGVFCGNKDGVVNYTNLYDSGTSKLIKSEDSNKNYTVKTLNTIIKDHPAFRDSNILKIDTDGFEFEVLQGGIEFITTATQVIFFELSFDDLENTGQHEIIKNIFSTFNKIGYEDSLFYDNFGNAREIVKTGNMEHILGMISKIDRKKIYYYDILVIHKDKLSHRDLIPCLLNDAN